jgi:uncharacterized protein (TIGR03435 family)
MWTNAPLVNVLEYAFDTNASLIEGQIPARAYDIQAVVPPSSSEDQIRKMFQRLLQERFGFRMHVANKRMSVFELVVGPKGSRLSASKEGDLNVGGKPILPNRAEIYLERDGLHLAGKSASMTQLCRSLSLVLKRPVLDHTGLQGVFDFDVLHAPEDTQPGVEFPLPTIRTAIQDELGLKLQAADREVEMLVVDALGEPTEN